MTILAVVDITIPWDRKAGWQILNMLTDDIHSSTNKAFLLRGKVWMGALHAERS